MKKLKAGISLIVLGNVLNFFCLFFENGETSNFKDFTSGILLGLSIGCNLVGIVLTVMYFPKNDGNNQ